MHSPMNLHSVPLAGRSGERYTFAVWPRQTRFAAKGGVYAMARHIAGERYDIIFIGETGDLSRRPFQKDRVPCFNQNGADHILCLDEQSAARRAAIVADLLQAMQPVCNRIG